MKSRLRIVRLERLRLYGQDWGSEIEAIVTCEFDGTEVEPLLVRRTKEGSIHVHSTSRLCLDGMPVFFLFCPNDPGLSFYDPVIPREVRAMLRDELARRLIDYAGTGSMLLNPRFGVEPE